jgi:hypothetical protein
MNSPRRIPAVVLLVAALSWTSIAVAGGPKVLKSRPGGSYVPKSRPSSWTIRILSPSEPRGVRLGQSLEIRFAAPESTERINVKLTLDGGASWSHWGSIPAEAGVYVFRAPSDTRACTNRAYVRLEDASERRIVGQTPRLTISPPRRRPRVHPEARIEITSPRSTMHMVNNHRYSIRWTAGRRIRNVRIKLSFDDGRTWTDLAENIPAQRGRYVFAIDDDDVMHTDRARFRVEDMTRSHLGDTTCRQVIRAARREDRELALLVPNERTRAFSGQRLTVRWQCPPGKDRYAVALQYTFDDGRTWRDIRLPGELLLGAEEVQWLVPMTDGRREAKLRLVSGGRRPLKPVESETFVIRQSHENGLNIPFQQDAIELSAPAGGGRFPLRGRMEIRWDAAEHVERVAIWYLPSQRCLGDEWVFIAVADADAGRCVWRIPNDRDLLSMDASILIQNVGNINEMDRIDNVRLMQPRRIRR